MNSETALGLNARRVRKIGVIGAGIVGIPMASMLAQARVCLGSDRPARVVLIQRNSSTSGWKVAAINSGKSPIGGIEPDLDRILAEAVSKGLLYASHDYSEIRDADVILICVQTDKDGFKPDYGPLFDALVQIVRELRSKPAEKIPLIVVESTLAPSSMITLIRECFQKSGLVDGRDIYLGNSPNRVMPGYLTARIRSSDKIVGGLTPLTPKLIRTLYSNIVTDGRLYLTNCMTAEIVKTLENAYRDVRIAYTAEIARYCDFYDINFYDVREKANDRISKRDNASDDPNIVPSGGILIPTIGVGGHCLPKDGVLLLWRKLEADKHMPNSVILEARRVNNESPAQAVCLLERKLGVLAGKSIAVMGVAYRFNSEDTRNSPSMVLAKQLIGKGCYVIMHDPYVKPNDENLVRSGLKEYFTQDLDKPLKSSELLLFCTAHRRYLDEMGHILTSAPKIKGIFDGCNLLGKHKDIISEAAYAGIGRGRNPASKGFVDFVVTGFETIEKGFANEIQGLINFLNERYALDNFNRVDFGEVRKLSKTCATGCDLADPGPIKNIPVYDGFFSRVVKSAKLC